mgnify:CR=1 FL=1
MIFDEATWALLSLVVMGMSLCTLSLLRLFKQKVVAGIGVEPVELCNSYARIAASCALAVWVIMVMGVEFFLVCLPLVIAAVVAADYTCRRIYNLETEPVEVVAFCYENLTLLLAVFCLRYFVVQHYRVPTGSLEPTVHVGDFILVNQFAYGWHLPLINTKLVGYGQPKRGDIVVFRYPKDPYRLVYVKRMVGLPGDRIVYRDKRLMINGELQPQALLEDTAWRSHRKEFLAGKEHDIYVDTSSYTLQDDIDIVVPEGHYFMMGDNRDNSADSRSWGPVPESLLVGKGAMVLFEWSGLLPDFSRSGTWL